MKRPILACIAMAASLSAASAGSETEDNIAAGHALAQKLCARCHAIGEIGDSPLPVAPVFRTMARKWPIDSLAEAFAEGIVVGHEAMPEFEFEAEQIGALLDYIESIQVD